MRLFKYIEFGQNKSFKVISQNGKEIGELYIECDGFYVFIFTQEQVNAGFWSAHYFREIADKIDELNKEWEREIETYFKKQ